MHFRLQDSCTSPCSALPKFSRYWKISRGLVQDVPINNTSVGEPWWIVCLSIRILLVGILKGWLAGWLWALASTNVGFGGAAASSLIPSLSSTPRSLATENYTLEHDDKYLFFLNIKLYDVTLVFGRQLKHISVNLLVRGILRIVKYLLTRQQVGRTMFINVLTKF